MTRYNCSTKPELTHIYIMHPLATSVMPPNHHIRLSRHPAKVRRTSPSAFGFVKVPHIRTKSCQKHHHTPVELSAPENTHQTLSTRLDSFRKFCRPPPPLSTQHQRFESHPQFQPEQAHTRLALLHREQSHPSSRCPRLVHEKTPPEPPSRSCARRRGQPHVLD